MAGKSFSLFLALILMSVLTSARRPLVCEKPVANTPPSDMEKIEDMAKLKVERKRLEHDDAVMKPDEVDEGLFEIPGTSADAGFHMNVGSFGFGFDGGLQFGYHHPSYVVPYSQHYVYSMPSPYPYPYQYPSGYGPYVPPQGYQGPDQKVWGYGSPGSGY